MPNKTSQNAANAFMLGKEFNSPNTKVRNENDVTILTLFGNDIAFNKNGEISITNSSWQSNTTRDRLNAIDGVHIVQRNKVWYLNDKPWNGKLIKI